MPQITPSFLFAVWAAFASAAWGAEAGVAAGQDWRNLLGNSPFAGATASTESPVPGALEFRGMVREGDDVWVNLYDPATRHAQWSLVPGSAGPGLRLESYDPATGHLMIVQAGRWLNLALRQAHVVLPADIRPLVLPVTAQVPAVGGNDRDSFVRQLPSEAREMLEQAERRRHPLVPDRAATASEFTNR